MKIITTILFIAAIVQSHAQKLSKEIKGDRLYDTYAFADAAETYSRAEKLTVDGYRKLAIAYTNIGNYAEAETTYNKFISTSTVAEDYFNYASLLKINGKYDEADKWMKRFSDAKPNDLRSKDYLANRDKMQTLATNPGQYKITRMPVNSDHDDFGPTYYQDKIVFASNRPNAAMVDHTYNWDDKPFLDLYMADVTNGELTNEKSFKSINKKWHEGPAAFSNNGTVMAFTQNNYESKSADGVVKFQLYFSELKNGEWTNEQSFKLNSAEYSVGHPWLSEDGNTMYFASDMPGGLGGSDLYRITKNEKGEWSTHENLGDAINTEGNEMFPFFESKSGVLFFASNGRMGLGGLDMFMSKLNDDKNFMNAINMGAGVNSSQDDFGFILDSKLEKGYFSSNRNNRSDDLYSVEVLKPLIFGTQINGFVRDKSGNAINEAVVVLSDSTGKTLYTTKTDMQGHFSFISDRKQAYSLKASAEKYYDATASVNTRATDVGNTEIVLRAVPEINIGTDLFKVIDMKPIFFDLGKYDIRPDAAMELDKIVTVMNDHPMMVVELGAHTDCRGTKASNQKLSDERAKSSAEYIRKRITNPDRIYGKGYGESTLINGCECEGNKKSNCSEDEHQQNRRTEFIVKKM